MQLDCPATVSTNATTGAVQCQDATGAAVAWVVVPDFDLTQLDPTTLSAYFSWGWFIVALGWVTGKGIGMVVKFLRQI
jgi:hypothetical protein